jgi:signal transduction histidine kinase
MTSNLVKNIPEGKQFRLVKYFALASFIVLLIFSFPFSVFISQKAKDTLTKNYEDYAIQLANNLHQQVLYKFSYPVLKKYDGIRLSDKAQHALMDRVIKDAIHGFNIDVVNVYTLDGIIGYSTDDRLYSEKPKETSGYQMAINGKHASGVISGTDDIWGLGLSLQGGEKKIRTFIPFRLVLYDDQNRFVEEFIAGVFEIIQDMTEQYKSITKFQYYVFALSILIMTLIFLTLLLIVHKAEQIIEHRAQEQRDLEAQLNLAERLASIGEMVAGVSHEIKNPLGIIQSTAELLEGMPDADETRKRLSRIITEETSRLNEKLREFLDFAKPQALDLMECHLEKIIQKNISFLTPELEKNNIHIQDDFRGRSFRLLADQKLLYQAFLNIFINAIQAMNGSGTISIGITREKNMYKIEVKDTGTGISEETLKKIFSPFFTTKQKGSGLGLSIVKKIVEDHQGILWIDSQINKGTTVTVCLPRRL